MNYGSIYVISNSHTGEQYVGQTIQTVQRRWKAHISAARNPKVKLGLALVQYGLAAFSCQEVYSAFTRDELNRVEKQYIKELNASYNMTRGGAGRPDKVITEAQRMATSKLSASRWANPEWRAKTTQALWGDPEVRTKRSAALKRRLATPESIQCRRDAQLGRKMSAASVYKSSAGKWKPVYCEELDTTFLSQKHAAEELNVRTSTISTAIKRKGRVMNKYTLVRVA